MLADIQKGFDSQLLEKAKWAFNPKHANLILFHRLRPFVLFLVTAPTSALSRIWPISR